jgi:hypothetical protein
MISFKPRKALGLILASAGILLHAHGALAAVALGDAQMQARDLLSGTGGGRLKAAAAAAVISADEVRAVNVEPQEQARQLILGKPSGERAVDRVVGSDLAMASVRRVRRAEIDPQEAARRMVQAEGV